MGVPPPTAGFWYLPEPARVTRPEHLEAYRSAPVPLYLVDYSAKLRYDAVGPDGIIRLHYRRGIGAHINPEAAFQFALAASDAHTITGQTSHLETFLHYARTFADRQKADGDWSYEFDWYESKAPWASALAQSRGVSVMLRAWLRTREERFRDAAVRAIAKFDVPTIAGGYLHEFRNSGHSYQEEYPAAPTAVVNGFMATLFGLWELATLGGCPPAQRLFDTGVRTLEVMLPHFTCSWWTLYDLDDRISPANYNSPRYHDLLVDYATILSVLCDSLVIAAHRDRWVAQRTPGHRMLAFWLKLIRKLRFR